MFLTHWNKVYKKVVRAYSNLPFIDPRWSMAYGPIVFPGGGGGETIGRDCKQRYTPRVKGFKVSFFWEVFFMWAAFIPPYLDPRIRELAEGGECFLTPSHSHF